MLAERGAARVDVAWVPGALEIPLAARRLAETRQYDAIICLGCVIKGETLHFDIVAQQAAAGMPRFTCPPARAAAWAGSKTASIATPGAARFEVPLPRIWEGSMI